MTTPEYVVDKATKLETINNRIHEIRTRFEVLLRDAETEKLISIGNNDNREKTTALYETKKSELTDDFQFIAECNSGEKFMEDDHIASNSHY